MGSEQQIIYKRNLAHYCKKQKISAPAYKWFTAGSQLNQTGKSQPQKKNTWPRIYFILAPKQSEVTAIDFYQDNEIIQLWTNQWQSLLFRFRSTVLIANTPLLNLGSGDLVNIFSICQQLILQTGQKKKNIKMNV